jgi:hypothetical protein
MIANNGDKYAKSTFTCYLCLRDGTGAIFSGGCQTQKQTSSVPASGDATPVAAAAVTAPVEVHNGISQIAFTSQIENPEINAIEIIPQS